ncbi:type VI secretion protein [Salmonella enterica subsp. enterica]|uniref:Type VI secretion protein n=1 Tax=Salmonella enterica I TaxID=59201 RepID=A0A3S4JIQ0_SALET|nr:type VI secretion protein [Salmonella enterica subsp. enterica]
MAINNSAQKFIARNRAPRVQIEYDVEIYGSEKKIELPFVMAVLADLAGKPREELPPVTDRKFLDIDIDNFNERMKAIAPRVAFAVPNTLTGEGQLMVDITLEKYGRLFAGTDCPQGGRPEPVTGSPHSTGEPPDLHGWPRRGRKIWSINCCRTRLC